VVLVPESFGLGISTGTSVVVNCGGGGVSATGLVGAAVAIVGPALELVVAVKFGLAFTIGGGARFAETSARGAGAPTGGGTLPGGGAFPVMGGGALPGGGVFPVTGVGVFPEGGGVLPAMGGGALPDGGGGSATSTIGAGGGGGGGGGGGDGGGGGLGTTEVTT
jgi:hypothetical protein